MELLNPILTKEMRTRMRGMRSFAILTIYALTLGLILGLFYWGFSSAERYGALSGLGEKLAAVAVFVQMALVCLISPTFTAAAISSEREQQTFELLVSSLATPWTILVGKVGASLFYLLLVLFGALPIVSFLYLVGGVSIVDILICYLVMLVSGLGYCTVSFLWSTLVRRAVLAQMISLVTVGVLVIAIPATTLVLQEFRLAALSGGGNRFFWESLFYTLYCTNPFFAQGDALFGPTPTPNAWLKGVPVWAVQCGFYVVLTVVAGYLSVKRLGTVRNWL
jgi:ABC-type transport system involved in multi-copper enzyme maturation permease subunit